MPGGKTSFSNSWLQGYDSNSHKISTWCRKKLHFETYSSLSYSRFSVVNRGNGQIMQHAGRKTHSSIANIRF